MKVMAIKGKKTMPPSKNVGLFVFGWLRPFHSKYIYLLCHDLYFSYFLIFLLDTVAFFATRFCFCALRLKKFNLPDFSISLWHFYSFFT